MNTISRTLSGAALCILGLYVVLVVLSESQDPWSSVWGVGWGVLVIGLGVYLFFNKKEDTIEEINDADNEE